MCNTFLWICTISLVFMSIHFLTYMSIIFNYIYLDMSILFSNFAVEIRY